MKQSCDFDVIQSLSRSHEFRIEKGEKVNSMCGKK